MVKILGQPDMLKQATTACPKCGWFGPVKLTYGRYNEKRQGQIKGWFGRIKNVAWTVAVEKIGQACERCGFVLGVVDTMDAPPPPAAPKPEGGK